MKKGNNFMFGLISLKDFSKELGKPESTIRTWKRRGELPDDLFKVIGNTIFVRVKKFEEWVENNP